MSQVTKKITWLQSQLKKDQNEITKKKKSLIKNIVKVDKLGIKNTDMPQAGESFYRDINNELENDNKVLEGYVNHFLEVVDSLEKTPLNIVDPKFEFSLEKNEFIKLFKEVEQIKSGGELEEEAYDIPDEFDVNIEGVKFLVTMV